MDHYKHIKPDYYGFRDDDDEGGEIGSGSAATGTSGATGSTGGSGSDSNLMTILKLSTESTSVSKLQSKELEMEVCNMYYVYSLHIVDEYVYMLSISISPYNSLSLCVEALEEPCGSRLQSAEEEKNNSTIIEW